MKFLRGLLLEGAASPPAVTADADYFSRLRDRVIGSVHVDPQNESARYNLAHPFSHDRSFIPMFVQW